MIVAAVLVGLLITAYLALRIERWRRTPAELRGDWWTQFEHEFRVYVRQTQSPRRPRRRRNDRSIGQ